MNCPRCGAVFDPANPAQAAYNESGELVCKRCASVEQIAVGDWRAVGTIKAAPWAALLVAVASTCFDPFFAMSFVAIAAGIASLLTHVRATPSHRTQLGSYYAVGIVVSIVAIVWAGGLAALRTLGFLLG